MVPNNMLEEATDTTTQQFFERARSPNTGREEWGIKQENPGSSRGGSSSSPQQQQQQQPEQPRQIVVPSKDPIASISEVIRAETSRKKKYPPSETGNSSRNYELFVDLIHRMLAYDPKTRITAADALNHPFVVSVDQESARR
jgi:serine/threonine protein kinase